MIRKRGRLHKEYEEDGSYEGKGDEKKLRSGYARRKRKMGGGGERRRGEGT